MTRFIETYPGGPVVYADGDGTVDVQMTDRFGERWFMYRAREGWPGVIIGETFRNSGVLRPTALPSWHYAEHPLWYQRVLEADYILGRRGTQGWDGQEEDRGVLIRNLAEEETDRDENWRDWAWGMIKGIGKALAVLALSLLVFATGGLAMFVLIGLAAVSLAASIGHRIAQGQTVGQVIGGSLADLTGVSGVYAGITGKDIATGEDLGLTYEQRGEMFGQGLVQVAATAIGAYKGIRGGIGKFRAWRRARRLASQQQTLAQHSPSARQSKYVASEHEGRKVFKNTEDFDPGVPEYIDRTRVHPKVLERLDRGATNLDLMDEGIAPIGRDGQQMNLHHVLGQEPGPMVELMGTTHQRYYRPLHGLIESGESFRHNLPLLNQYNNFRGSWWRARAADFRL